RPIARRYDRAVSRPDSRVVAALAATTTAGYGVLFYAYGVLLVPMERDLGWSRPFLSGVFSIALIVSALATVPVGRWLDRHQPRGLFLAGAAAGSVLVAGWGLAHGRVLFVVTWVLLGCCQAILFYEPAFTVLTKRFDGQRRNRAITSVTLVAGLASTIFGPLTAALEGALGWRGAVLVLAALLAAVTIPCFAVGLRVGDPDRAPGPDPTRSALPRDAFVTRPFWLLTAAYLFTAVTTFAIGVHLVPYLTGRGFGAATAAAALGAVGLVQVLGRSTFIRLSANRASVHLATWVLAAKGVGIGLLLVVPGLSGVVMFVLVYGSANGVGTLTRATTIAELYGPAHYGAISAVMASVTSIGGAMAPFAAAAAIELVGDDDPVLAGLVGLSLAAAACNELVGRGSRGSAGDGTLAASRAKG
ncbi:MAG: MFS transporter, partial [Actinomycetota bacterium]